MLRRMSWLSLVSAHRRISAKVVTTGEGIAELRDLDTLAHLPARILEEDGAIYAIIDGTRYRLEPANSQMSAMSDRPRGRPRTIPCQ